MLKRLMMAGLLGLGLAGPAAAEEEALLSFQVLAPETALDLARAALAQCREEGYQVAVVVVDRFGTPQVMLRDRFAGPHTPETARRKAWTAVSFRSDTLALAAATGPDAANSGVRFISDALMLGGGVQVEAAGSVVGGVGISGAPSGEADDACARAGIAAVAERLAF